MEYKGYIGIFTFDEKLELFQGRVSNTKDLITFQGKTLETVYDAFRDAVNEYLTWCKKTGKIPEKPEKQSPKNNPFLYGP